MDMSIGTKEVYIRKTFFQNSAKKNKQIKTYYFQNISKNNKSNK